MQLERLPKNIIENSFRMVSTSEGEDLPLSGWKDYDNDEREEHR